MLARSAATASSRGHDGTGQTPLVRPVKNDGEDLTLHPLVHPTQIPSSTTTTR